MKLRLTVVGTVAIAFFGCTCLYSLPVCEAADLLAGKPAGAVVVNFPYEKAKKAITAYLTRNNGMKPSFVGYRMINDTEAEVYFLLLDTYSSVKLLLLTTDSGRRWFLMVDTPKPLGREKHLEQIQD